MARLVSELTALPLPIVGTDLFRLDRANAPRRATAADLATYFGGSFVAKTGDTMTGQLNVLFNLPATSGNAYADGHIELITTDGSFPRIGFHRGGLNATALYYGGEDGFGSVVGVINNAGSNFRLAYSNFANNWTAAQAFVGTNTATGGFSAGGMSVVGINSGVGADYSVLDFYPNRFLSYRISTNTYQFHDAALTVNNRVTANHAGVSGPGVPNTFAMGVSGPFGGGFQMIDGSVHTGMWAQSDTTMRFGVGTSAGLTEKLRLGTSRIDAAVSVVAPAFIAEFGAPNTQQILQVWRHNDGVDRVYGVIEATGNYSLYMKTAAGAAGPNSYHKLEIALDAQKVTFDANGIIVRDIYAIRPASPGTGVIFLGNSGSRYLFYNGSSYELNGAGILINGGPLITQEVGKVRIEGGVRAFNRWQTLTADSTGWHEQPRVFVQVGDPGAQAADGDLWAW